MKKFFFSFLFVIAGASMAYSQDTFGIKAGLNLASQFIRIDNQSAKTKIAPTFHVSAYYDARISPGFSIQPGISLEGKGGRSEIDGFYTYKFRSTSWAGCLLGLGISFLAEDLMLLMGLMRE